MTIRIGTQGNGLGKLIVLALIASAILLINLDRVATTLSSAESELVNFTISENSLSGLEKAEQDMREAWDAVGEIVVAKGNLEALEEAIAKAHAADDAYVAEILQTKFATVIMPDIGRISVADEHILERHGQKALDILKTSGWSRRPCGDDGKKEYLTKYDSVRGVWWLAVSWKGRIMTCYETTKGYIAWWFDYDDCPPPLNIGHDWMTRS